MVAGLCLRCRQGSKPQNLQTLKKRRLFFVREKGFPWGRAVSGPAR